jgi:hypothetical protein
MAVERHVHGVSQILRDCSETLEDQPDRYVGMLR